jgi:hypothetical protein
LRGAWNSKTAGGCMNHKTWLNNPKWKVWVAGCEKEPPKKPVSEILNREKKKEKEQKKKEKPNALNAQYRFQCP